MKKLTLFFALCLSISLQAATSKTVSVATAGTLSSYFSSSEYTTVTDLTLSGTIDARDFKFIRDTLTVLENLDMSTVNIAEYTGVDGTIIYPGGSVPYSRLYYSNAIPTGGLQKMSTLKSIVLPNSLTKIEGAAFYYCTALTSIIIPESVNALDNSIFSDCNNLEHIQFNSQIAPSQENGTNMITLFGLTKRPITRIYLPANSQGYLEPENLGGWDLESNTFIIVYDGKISDYIIPTAINETTTDSTEKTVMAYYSITGLKLSEEPEKGIYIVTYSNGESEKRMK